MGEHIHAHVIAALGENAAEFRVTGELVLHVGDEVRQLVAGVEALEVRSAVDVVTGVDQPVGVEHHDGVHAQLTASAADFAMAVDGRLAAALARAGQFGEVHRWNVSDLGSQSDFAHDNSPGVGRRLRGARILVIVAARRRCWRPRTAALSSGRAHTPQRGM
ncbi:hypothetical protein D9M71_677640 [compost metagenome]